MFPLLRHGQIIFASSIPFVFTFPKVGDVVVLHDPRNGKKLVKRIVKQEENRFFVEGDNNDESTDSRVFGWIEKDAIIAKAIFFHRN